MDWTITLTLGAVALTIGLSLTINYVRNKMEFTTKTKKGDILIAQATKGLNTAAVTIKGNGNQVNTNNGSGSLIISSPKYGETEKRAARKSIKLSFDGFFYTFLGNENSKAMGMLNHPPHLDKNNPKKFASHYEQTARDTFRRAKAKLEEALNTHAPILENMEVEKNVAEQFEKINIIQDVFEITEELRSEINNNIFHILNNN